MARAIRSCPIREIAGAVPGTSAASKIVILDENAKIDMLDITTLKFGGATVATSATFATTAAFTSGALTTATTGDITGKINAMVTVQNAVYAALAAAKILR